MNNELKIPVYIINLDRRLDRREHIEKEFKNRPEYNLNVVKAKENDIGSLGLWKTIIYILTNLINRESEYIIIGEDDHLFTANYSAELLLSSIGAAQKKKVDILLGGVSWFETPVQISPDLFWIDKFNGMQFTVIFNNFYDKIVKADFSKGETADLKISSLSSNIVVIYPFISIQKEFGYSDVTSSNNIEGYIERIFKNSLRNLNLLNEVPKFYGLTFK